MKKLETIDFTGKVALVRCDLNVPMSDGEITDDNRIVEAVPTLKLVASKGAKVVILSHLGRVKTDEDKKGKSLKPVAQSLGQHLGANVTFVGETRGSELEAAIASLKPGEFLMMENTRFEDVNGSKESKNNEELAKYWASLGDVFVNDAFGTLHRAHASNVGLATYMKEKAPGLLIQKELDVFNEALNHPKRPFVAVLGGAKVSDKIGVIRTLLKKADKVIVAGGMSYTFLKAKGFEIGTSLVENDKLDLAKELLVEGEGILEFADDFKVTESFSNDAPIRVAAYDDFKPTEMGLDIGPKSLERFSTLLKSAKQVIWNGPVGVFEMSNFAKGTEGICQVLASLEGATTIIGGGDSAAAAIQMGFKEAFTHISTGGGASLEFLEGKDLPGLVAME